MGDGHALRMGVRVLVGRRTPRGGSRLDARGARLGRRARRPSATALYFDRANAFWQDPDDWLVPGLDESAALFRREGERSGEALALISLALALLGAREPDAARADGALDRASPCSARPATRGARRWPSSPSAGSPPHARRAGGARALRREPRRGTAPAGRPRRGDRPAPPWVGRAPARRLRRSRAPASSRALRSRRSCITTKAWPMVSRALPPSQPARAMWRGPARSRRSAGRPRAHGHRIAPSFSFHQQFVDGILAGPGARDSRGPGRGRHLRVDERSRSHCNAMRRLSRHPSPNPKPRSGIRPDPRRHHERHRSRPAHSSAGAARRPRLDRVLPYTRVVAYVIIPFLVAAASAPRAPGGTEQHFAWTIDPPVTAMLLGSRTRAASGSSCRSPPAALAPGSHGFPAVLVFASLLAAATFLHWDRFHFGTCLHHVGGALRRDTGARAHRHRPRAPRGRRRSRSR